MAAKMTVHLHIGKMRPVRLHPMRLAKQVICVKLVHPTGLGLELRLDADGGFDNDGHKP